jgi:hypothetical protein
LVAADQPHCATPKNFGDALLHPREFISICRSTYFVFFFAFFFAGILFSSKLFEFSRQHCWRSAYSFSCIVIPIYLVKKKVMLWQKKMKNATPASAKIENAQLMYRRIPAAVGHIIVNDAEFGCCIIRSMLRNFRDVLFRPFAQWGEEARKSE